MSETTFFLCLEQEKTKAAHSYAKQPETPATLPVALVQQGLRRFIGKYSLNTNFAIFRASLVWPQVTAVLQTDLTKTA
ncbi:hypothetical protein [Pseudomonas sp. p106]|uniref:hypothetical protein n=1 Tax=Pseudomonas sp. p106 TaxID=2479854 RepID=UPI000F790AD9|nr:hypothetical protein [Pseudomonas sp. p106]